MSPVTELVVMRSLLACAKFMFHDLSSARPGEGDKCCEAPLKGLGTSPETHISAALPECLSCRGWVRLSCLCS